MATSLPPVAPRTDLRTGFFWMAFGALAVFLSWQMDRFETQGATLHSAPGLWPGIVGLVIALLGGALAWRSITRARESGWGAAQANDTRLVPRSQLLLAGIMFLTYALLLVGHGLPFWLGTGLFVTLFVYLFRRADRLALGRAGSNGADALLAIVCGVATAFVVTFAFQQLFYVRLP